MDLNAITEWLGKLYGAPGYILVFLLCVAVCKGLRSTPNFPNNGIWAVMILLGAALNMLIAEPESNDPTTVIIKSFRVWMGKVGIFGGLVGFLAFLSYNTVLRRFGWFSGDDDRAEAKEKRDETKTK